MHTQSFAFRLKKKTCGQQFFTTEFFQLRRSPNRIHRMVGVLNNFIDFVFSSTLSSLPIFTLAPRIYTLYVMCLYYSIALFSGLIFDLTANNRVFHSTSTMWINMRFHEI